MTGHCYWRYKGDRAWQFGYMTEGTDHSTCRMGSYAGHVHGAPLIERSAIETKPYRDHLR